MKTTRAQRAFLLTEAVFISLGVIWSYCEAAELLWVFAPCSIFAWLVVFANWETTMPYEPEWHDYR